MKRPESGIRNQPGGTTCIPFPEQHIPQALDARRARNLFIVGLTTILVAALAVAVIAFQPTRAGSADPQVTTIGPAVYGWLPAPQVDLASVDASRTGPAVYGWLPAAEDRTTGPEVYGWLPAAEDRTTGPEVYGWLPDAEE